MATTAVPLFPGLPGGPELLILLLIIVVLFGANKLPKLARSSGQAMGEFQKGREEVEQELQEMREKGTESVTGSDEDEDATTTTATTSETVTETEAETETEKQN
ncbi:twin-arginine translocase TatA/TatE family subunit [Halomarina pelagica]|uniref:twin-arginine translocase TatA/TatE family subunit n=1 Tax=Halomarina pelagica TaxID=2961599 RepID=UPI0020C535E6|nr:twin-arginine translocase TatA/TatE family subunit [Halomarina sp. BND7]